VKSKGERLLAKITFWNANSYQVSRGEHIRGFHASYHATTCSLHKTSVEIALGEIDADLKRKKSSLRSLPVQLALSIRRHHKLSQPLVPCLQEEAGMPIPDYV
jgi:hypothetical protein